MKQTAVEWYEKEVNSLIEKYEAKEISKRDFITMKHNLFYPAKEMEKQQQGYSEEKVDELLDKLLKYNMCSFAGDELINKFKNK